MLFSLAQRISSLDERGKPVGQILTVALNLFGFRNRADIKLTAKTAILNCKFEVSKRIS